jgi:hypothetical protein
MVKVEHSRYSQTAYFPFVMAIIHSYHLFIANFGVKKLHNDTQKKQLLEVTPMTLEL